MSGRVGRQPTTPAIKLFDLPAASRPQVVNAAGYELYEDELEKGSGKNALDDNAIILDAQHDGERQRGGQSTDREPLLSLADSLVLQLSLLQSRRRHQNSLLPLIFTHPPVPAHNRPRARPYPKSTFFFPTPPPPVHPLPANEYHGTLRPYNAPPPFLKASIPPVTPVSATSPGPASPATNITPTSSAPPQPTKTAKAWAKNEPPPHEIECIARVTVMIGPISYPGTELWVGRFVEPRVAPPVQRREKVQRVERQSTMGGDSTGYQRQTIPASNPPGSRGPGRPPGPSASTSSAPPLSRNKIPVTLIQQVNRAATQHPWLSDLIHKAAKSQASKEELATLGRVVERLNKGQSVGEEHAMGTSASASTVQPPTGSQATTVQPGENRQGQSSAVSNTAATAISVNSAPHRIDEDSDSELSDIDMSGPEQVGGGPVPPPLLTADAPLSSGSLPAPLPTQPRPPQMQYAPPHPTQHYTPAAPRPSGYYPYQASVSTNNNPRPPNTYQPAYRPPYPPPHRRIFPLPPPFLLIAFKESPTEKFLLPLGSLSYISRAGGDVVTHPAPLPPPTVAVKAETEILELKQDEAKITPVVSKPKPKGKAKGKRASRSQAKAESVEVAVEAEEEEASEDDDEVEPAVPEKEERSVLSGMKPTPGTVLISTIVPVEKWLSPDWEKLGARLPFVTKEFDIRPENTTNPTPAQIPAQSQPNAALSTPVIKQESATGIPASVSNGESTISQASVAPLSSQPEGRPSVSADMPNHGVTAPMAPPPDRSPRTSRQIPAEITVTKATNKTSGIEAAPSKPVKPSVLNLANQSFLPSDTAVMPVTIRLSGVSDSVWKRIQRVMKVVEDFEHGVLARDEPELKEAATSMPVGAHTTIGQPANLGIKPSTPQLPGHGTNGVGASIPSDPMILVKETWLQRKKKNFERLLKRVPPRTFLRYRIEDPPPAEYVEALSDRWAAKPLALSTKSVLQASPPPDLPPDLLSTLSLGLNQSKKRKSESEVTFEMPMSFEELDESVERGAEFLGGRRGRGRGGKGVDGRRNRKSRGIGLACQGCGRVDTKVWRRGPNGKSTLCNACGDKFLAGTLGPLAEIPKSEPEFENKNQTAEINEETEHDKPSEASLHAQEASKTELSNEEVKHAKTNNDGAVIPIPTPTLSQTLPTVTASTPVQLPDPDSAEPPIIAGTNGSPLVPGTGGPQHGDAIDAQSTAENVIDSPTQVEPSSTASKLVVGNLVQPEAASESKAEMSSANDIDGESRMDIDQPGEM